MTTLDRRQQEAGDLLDPLDHAEDALWPLMSATALRHHRTKVELGLLRRLRRMVPGARTDLETLERLVVDGSPPVCWLAAEVWNHVCYWRGLSPDGGGMPRGGLDRRIRRDFGEVGALRARFNEQASRHLGSGWAWLVLGPDGRLDSRVTGTKEHPLRDGQWPLLACDLWEHAHYLDHGHNRDHYLQTWWRFVDWSHVESRLGDARRVWAPAAGAAAEAAATSREARR